MLGNRRVIWSVFCVAIAGCVGGPTSDWPPKGTPGDSDEDAEESPRFPDAGRAPSTMDAAVEGPITGGDESASGDAGPDAGDASALADDASLSVDAQATDAEPADAEAEADSDADADAESDADDADGGARDADVDDDADEHL